MAAESQVPEGAPAGQADQPAVELVSPGMIGTDDAHAAIALRPVEKPRRPVPADIVERAHLPVMAAHGEHQFAEEVERMIITGLRDVVDMADELPGRHEQPFGLQLEELRIEVGPGRQATT